LPGKNGIGGGIIAIQPGQFCIAVWSPQLNVIGKPYKVMRVLEALTSKTKSSIF
jgi:glutaminase